MIYSRTHAAPLPSVAIVAVGIVALVIGIASSTGWLVVVGACLIVGGCLSYALSALTATVTEGSVELGFRLGWPHKTIPLGDILRAEVVRNSWWSGWGIRWMPGGTLWNVWGLDAVELALASGKRFRIGTDQPTELADAIGTAHETMSGVAGCWGV